ncbi:hypothetical protein CPter91_5149 [Collimonas pratensis]|uniref:Uncharacterized protein n=1 Tax=Collimonas pratensis TaxID=279113 RepID=A0A127QBL8_9BURK|nr:hypothetical protein CPter91_5149 [Collimonas pratensis]
MIYLIIYAVCRMAVIPESGMQSGRGQIYLASRQGFNER